LVYLVIAPVSIHASLQQRGEHLLPAVDLEVEGVSIHASLQQRGELKPVRAYAIGDETFQSTPHFSSEANARRPAAVNSPDRSFNPRLTSAARRTFIIDLITQALEFQSTPHFSSEANDSSIRVQTRIPMFQSTPHFSSEANSLSMV